MVKRETYMSRIRPFIGGEFIKVKLIQAELLENNVMSEQFITINFEDMRYSHLLNAKALHDEIMERAKEITGKVYIFFDEIQEVSDWEKCVNSLRVALDCDIYITGSNAKLLSGELSTYLGGRYVEFVIYPFSFAEFIELYHTIIPDASIAQCFQKYLLCGGMPYLSNLHYEEEPSKQYLTDVFISNMELLRRGYSVTVERSNDREINFVCQKREQKLYVQVAYLLASEETIQREFEHTTIYVTIFRNMWSPLMSLI